MKRKFSCSLYLLPLFPHPQADQTGRQQAAEFRAALTGRHVGGGQGIGATEGTGIEHHNPWVPDYAAARDLGTGQPTRERKG